ncbi:MAG: hypothetical protein HY822_25535 [Acidobacteria bacterium]|nr:hypothetical protein [Acidobacteriota bacterium]
MRLLAIFIPLAATVWAAPTDVQALLGLAYAAPPEIAADALLRAAASDKLADRKAKIDLIEQAFQLAGQARERYRRRHIAGAPADSRSGAIDRAARLKLDSLSLRVRAVSALLELDKAKARAMFGRIEVPAPAPLACEEALVYDFTDFYALAAGVASQTFSAEERRLEQHIAFVRPFLLGIVSPAQVAPAARLARSVAATPAQSELLAASFSAGLGNVAADSRSFLASEPAAAEDLDPLAAQRYLARQRAAPQCLGEGLVIDLGAMLGLAGNKQAQEAGPSRVAKLHRYWTSPAAQAMLARGMRLRWGPSGAPGRMPTLEERKSAEWQNQLAETLNELASWKPGPEESEADYFHQRCLFYESLVELTPPGETRDAVVRALIEYLSGSSMQRESPAEWLSHGAELLSRLRLSGDSDGSRLLDAFLRSDNAALALLARLERLAPVPAIPDFAR